MAEFCISTSGLVRRYNAANFSEIRFSDVQIPAGGVVAVVGQSGVGKTTLVNMLSGVDAPEFTSGGSLTLATSSGKHSLPNVDYPHSDISIIFQRGYLISDGSVELNLGTVGSLANPKLEAAALENALRNIGLPTSYLEKRSWQISGGEGQRVGLARALIRDPDIIFADEPTSNLDYLSAQSMLESLKEWVGTPAEACKQPRTLVWISHDLHLVSKFADKILFLSRPGLEEDSVRSVQVELCANDFDEQSLKNWINHRRDDQTPSEQVWPTRPVNAIADTNRIAAKLANSELYSRRSVFRRKKSDSFLKILRTVATSWTETGGAFMNVRRLWPAFAPRNALLLTFLTLIITTAMALAVVDRWVHYKDSLSDPRNCQIVVTGGEDDAGLAKDLTPSAVDTLAMRDWSLSRFPDGHAGEGGEYEFGEETFARSSCSDGPAAFGRVSRLPPRVCSPKGASNDLRKRIRRERVWLMVSRPNDPILQLSEATAGTYTGQSIADLWRSDWENTYIPNEERPKRGDIFITADFANRLDRLQVEYKDGLCLSGLTQGKPQHFRVVMVVDRLQAPGREPYDVFIPENHLAAIQGEQVGSYNYNRVHLYFDPHELGALRAYLDGENWDVSDDALDGVARLIRELQTAFWASLALFFGNVLLFIALCRHIAVTHLEKNATAYAMLQSFGLPWTTAARQSVCEFKVLLLLSVIGGTLVAIIGVLFPTLIGYHAFPRIPGWAALPVLGAVAAFFFGLNVLSARIVAYNWFKQHTKRSEVLD